ncbi:MAG: class I SAM-dependent methyltransferase [Myxococcota bacterium]
MSAPPFTGERLHADNALFGVDLARHRAAYRFAADRVRGRRVLDLGCGTGYGAAELSSAAGTIVGLDRVAPDPAARRSTAHWIRADLNRVPLEHASFDVVLSFQVIEHLEDPQPYLGAATSVLRPDGVALFTTPNLLTSDRENPFHVHEYEASELAELLANHFGRVELLGISAGPTVAPYFEARLERIRRITRLDPLGLRRRLPRALVERLFGILAIVVRRGIRGGNGMPEATWRDFPIEPVHEACLDLLAVCREPCERRAA